MKKTLLLTAALVAVLLPMPAMVAHAQAGGVDDRKANTRANRKAEQAKSVKAPAQFPNATREEPKPEPSKVGSGIKDLNALVEAQKDDEALAKADAIIANPKATAMDRSTAALFAAAAWRDKDTSTFANAIKYQQQALDLNGLPNNEHFGNMLQLAQMLRNDERYAETLTVVDRYLAETKSEDPKAYEVKGDALYRLKRPAESNAALEKAVAGGAGGSNAAAMMQANYKALGKTGDATKLLEDMAAQKPNDKLVLQNLADAYSQAKQHAKAVEVVNRMRSGSMLTEPNDYEIALKVLMRADGHQKDGMALMNEGVQKGVLKQDYRTYAMLGQMQYEGGLYPEALASWSKAAPLAKDGEMYLNVARLHSQDGRWAEAKAAARQGLDKGVKKKGDAWMLIAQAEQGANDRNATIAALREAAKFPETRKQAEEGLREAAGTK
jgi:tetratricopeptide (TPR) repeat protein